MNQIKWEKFSKKSNKQKCLIMWTWLKNHPSIKEKDQFFIKNFDMNWKEVDLLENKIISLCFACQECAINCDLCPIQWPFDSCVDDHSPFYIWRKDSTNISDRKKAANEIIRLIKETWLD